MTARKNIQHVMQGSAARRGNNADASRQRRNGLAPRRIKQTFLGQPGFELFKSKLQSARADGFQKLCRELQFAARVIDGDAATCNDLHTALRPEAEQTRLTAKHHDAELSIAILECEVEMTGFRGPEVGYFA